MFGNNGEIPAAEYPESLIKMLSLEATRLRAINLGQSIPPRLQLV